jgi:secreted PhoX family phosphatase
MNSVSRRRFLHVSGGVAASFYGLRSFCDAANTDQQQTQFIDQYGPLVPDADKILDLPRGFQYRIISRIGDQLDDGLLLPGLPDGMATFAGPNGRTILIRNHELLPDQENAFGKQNERLERVGRDRLYDYGQGKTPGAGGTSTVVFNTKTQRIERQFMSLLGTYRNCAGGPTPWNSWISCEETVDRAGRHEDGYLAEKDHGYCFEVPASAKIGLADPLPLTAMGRFNHEAIAVDPISGAVYETEDRDDGLFFRFLPKKPGQLAAGGKLQALQIVDQKSADTRNWDAATGTIGVGRKLSVEWIDMDDVDSPKDDLRYRGHNAGAARFARGEGIWTGSQEIYFACTSGGAKKAGQIWRYVPSPHEGTAREKDHPGTLELFIEPNDTKLLRNADNLTIAGSGDLIVCEDHGGSPCRLVGVTPEGQLYLLARNQLNTEFAGVCFSPDGSTLFVNLQKPGLTVAISGNWNDRKQSS